MKIKILSTIALLMASITLQANEGTKKWYDGFYTGLGLSFTEGMEVKSLEAGSVDLLPNNVLFDVYTGYELHKYLNIEVSLSNALRHINTETYSGYLDQGTSEMKYSYYTLGVALKPKYHINENHIVFGVLGINVIDGTMKEEYEDSYSKGSFSSELASIGYRIGLGYEYKFNNEHSLLVDYSYNILGDVEFADEDGDTYKVNDGKAGSPTVNNYNLFGISYKYTFR